MLVWRKLSSSKWEDTWLERLSFIDSRRIAVTSFSGGKTIRIEAYGLTKSDADQLLKGFGGQVRELNKRDFIAANAKPHTPLRIGDKVLVVRSEKEKRKFAAQFPGRNVIVIPAEMAFGTGDHATTAACLRLLCRFSASRRDAPWEMLDLGTGTGILPITSRILGARRADALDFDPACVRAAHSNAKLNGIRLSSVRRTDVTKWRPASQWDVVTANLYSKVLIVAAPQIARAVKTDGVLIISGILREQEKVSLAAFRAQNFSAEKTVRRGKWVTCLLRPRNPLTPLFARE